MFNSPGISGMFIGGAEKVGMAPSGVLGGMASGGLSRDGAGTDGTCTPAMSARAELSWLL